MIRSAAAGGGLLLALAPFIWAQSPRDEYRRQYERWRQTEPTLEGDAAAAAGDLPARVQRASAAARAYLAARIEFLDGIAREAADQLKRMQDLGAATPQLAGPSPQVQSMVTGTAETVSRIADSFGTTADPGIRQVRNALQQERAALDAISQAMGATRQAMGTATVAGIDVEAARQNLLRAYQGVAAARSQAADQMQKSGAVWEAYYQALANPPAAVSSGTAPPAKPTIAAAAPAIEVVRPVTITPLPLLRYIGAWTFPSGGIFHGTQPQTVDITVREENGHVTGIFYARFAIPAGSFTDPVVQFNFEGNLTANRNQVFNLRTGEGTTGTIELIPGPAFNLLEVNFQTEMRSNRVRSGNFLLVKK